jgi:hypothetical protein
MLEPIKYETKIKLKDMPLQWISRFETFYPDLAQYPITYINLLTKNGERVYGFIVSFSFDISSEKLCDVEVSIVTNKNIDKNKKLKELVKNEVAERIGLTGKINLKNLVSYCNGNKEYENFFKEIWKSLSSIFGDEIPYGKFYEEIYSMVRFVSAWQPKTGRQSEMRMLYNFLSIFGERIEIKGKWNFLEFFLLPTYQDVKNNNLDLFPKFKMLHQAMEKIWKIYFTQNFKLGDMEVHSMERSWPQDKDTFIAKITRPLFKEKKINAEEKQAIDRLVDAFNRHSWRAAFYIWSVMSIKDKDYYTWDKDFFTKFYLEKGLGVGISPKVIACFLQQGFRNEEIIPIDTWIESFYKLALGIETKEEFFKSFSKMGKIERIIWLSSQAKKTNIRTFFDTLWCIRYGDTGNNELRGANPIACYECKFRNSCPSFNKIKKKKVFVIDNSKVIMKDFLTKKNKVKGKFLDSEELVKKAESKECFFICITENGIPKKILEKRGKVWKLIDEFSGYLLTNHKLKSNKEFILTDDFIKKLPKVKNFDFAMIEED